MASSCFQRSRERVLWTWKKKIHMACKFLACVLPSCTKWRQDDDRWWPNGLLAGCILIHLTPTLFRHIQIHSLRLTSPKRGLPSKQVVFHYHQFFGAMLLVSGRLPIINVALAESLREVIRLLAFLECCLPPTFGPDSIEPWTNFTPWLLNSQVRSLWLLPWLFDWSLTPRNAAPEPTVLCDKRLEGAWEASRHQDRCGVGLLHTVQKRCWKKYVMRASYEIVHVATLFMFQLIHNHLASLKPIEGEIAIPFPLYNKWVCKSISCFLNVSVWKL